MPTIKADKDQRIIPYTVEDGPTDLIVGRFREGQIVAGELFPEIYRFEVDVSKSKLNLWRQDDDSLEPTWDHDIILSETYLVYVGEEKNLVACWIQVDGNIEDIEIW